MTEAEKIETESLTHQEELHRLIEQMNEYQAELVLSFIKNLFGLPD